MGGGIDACCGRLHIHIKHQSRQKVWKTYPGESLQNKLSFYVYIGV